jgi:hypothetical protein
MRAAAIAVALAAASLTACGSGQWREVDARLRAASAPARAAGLVPLAGRNNEFGAFTDSATARWTLALAAGRAYVLAAVCSEHCGGLDLEITLPDSTVLGRDSSGGTVAALSFQTPATGAHPVRLSLAGCRDGTCRWAAQLYSRP